MPSDRGELRFQEPLNAGQEAEVDQWLTGWRQIDREWPFNQQLLNTRKGEDVLLTRRAEPWSAEYMVPGRSYLIFPQGLVIEVGPSRRSIEATARDHLPIAAGECDLCDADGIAFLAVVAMGHNLIGLQVCDLCNVEYQPDNPIPIGASA